MLVFAEVGVDPYLNSSFAVNSHHLGPHSEVMIFFVEFLEPVEHTEQNIKQLILLNSGYLVEADRYSFNEYSCILATSANAHAFFQVDVSSIDNILLVSSLTEGS